MYPSDILHFWFDELTDKQHFTKDTALNATMRERFGATLEAAGRCAFFAWRATPEGRLAEILGLDQFSRNIFRETPKAMGSGLFELRRKGPEGIGRVFYCTQVGGSIVVLH